MSSLQQFLAKAPFRMIGVIADPADHEVVREFFELFKTPWEFYSTNRRYEVVLSAGESRNIDNAQLVIHYSGRKLQQDGCDGVESLGQQNSSRIFCHALSRIPVYGNTITFKGDEDGFLFDEESRRCTAYRVEGMGGPAVVRVGYDLFSEIRGLA